MPAPQKSHRDKRGGRDKELRRPEQRRPAEGAPSGHRSGEQGQDKKLRAAHGGA
jgi:hypothetical protein